ncbi:MAG: Dihydrolipoyl dehydrogenase 3 [Alphaproteobacteria bacterium MarineAlpha5_Bin5]|nr:MAG: Dihydrolipoyl dehydrogenase 3 [Alphaproteobacteria bacterium MarineAlpha5_Bin5]|tara:strand:- start:444 stop:1841 length:1398 start_codon:yes stop_codon:yes gene_type:complete
MNDFDLVVIGAGPGGYVASIRAAQLGMKVACIEKESTLGGTCLNIGCIPSKALLNSSEKFMEISNHAEEHGIKATKVDLDVTKLMQRKEKIVKKLTTGIGFLFKKNNIIHIPGTATFVDKNTISVKNSKQEITVSANNFIIATGSSSIAIPNIAVDEKQIVTSTGALSLNKVPKTLLVIGGGYIGLEMGSVWCRFGSKVTVVEALDRIVPTMDDEIATEFMKSLKKQGLEFKLSHKVTSTKVSKSGVEVKMQSFDKKELKEKYEIVLMSVGRKPNTEGLNLENIGIKLTNNNSIEIGKNFQTSVEGIYAIGDVVPGPMLAHKAEEEGVACVEIIKGQKTHINYDAIPAIVYTNPEIASVGKTEEQLKELNIDYKVGKFPFMANGRALTTSSTDGFVKILADSKTDQILGAHIIGHDAGQLIAEIVTAMEFGGSAEDIARICHAHPTTSEAVKEAAMNIVGRAIHI